MKFRNEHWLIHFGKHLAALRKQQNYTQEKLALESNLELSQIARIETGKTNPTICTIILIAQTLNIKPAKMLDTYFAPPKTTRNLPIKTVPPAHP